MAEASTNRHPDRPFFQSASSRKADTHVLALGGALQSEANEHGQARPALWQIQVGMRSPFVCCQSARTRSSFAFCGLLPSSFVQKMCEYDVQRNEAHLDFAPGCACIELVTTRLVLERRREWKMTRCLDQVYFARAYDSVPHTAIWRAMKKRNIPTPLALAYLREARRAQNVVRAHGVADGASPRMCGTKAGWFAISHFVPLGFD